MCVWLAVVVVSRVVCEMVESGMDEVVRSCVVGGAGNGLPSLLLLPCCHGPACLCRRRTPPSPSLYQRYLITSRVRPLI